MGKFSYYSIPSSAGALGRNKDCENAPTMLAEIFGKNPLKFELKKNDVVEQQRQIFEQAGKAFKSKGVKVFFGGTHDITFSTFKAFAKHDGKKALVVFDAHADCDEGLNTPSHEDFIRALVMQRIAKPSQILLFGVKKVFASEKRFLKKTKIKKTSSTKELLSFLKKHERIYLSFDVDVLSERVMKATHFTNPKGLSIGKAAEAVNAILDSGKLAALDIIELNPAKAREMEKRALKKIFARFF